MQLITHFRAPATSWDKDDDHFQQEVAVFVNLAVRKLNDDFNRVENTNAKTKRVGS